MTEIDISGVYALPLVSPFGALCNETSRLHACVRAWIEVPGGRGNPVVQVQSQEREDPRMAAESRQRQQVEMAPP